MGAGNVVCCLKFRDENVAKSYAIAKWTYCALFTIITIVTWVLRWVAVPGMWGQGCGWGLGCANTMSGRSGGRRATGSPAGGTAAARLPSAAAAHCWHSWLVQRQSAPHPQLVDWGRHCSLVSPRPRRPGSYRDYSQEWFFSKLPATFNYCKIPGYESLCSSKEVAVRFSFANFSFFAAHTLLLFWCTKGSDFRAGIHTGLWFWKLLAWAGAIVGFFFVPSNAITVYAQVARCARLWLRLVLLGVLVELRLWSVLFCCAHPQKCCICQPPAPALAPHPAAPRFGAGLFLVFVMVEMVSWVYDINTWLVNRDAGWAWALLVLGAAISFLGGLALIGASYYYFAPTPACHLNLFFITWSIVVGFALVGVLFIPKRLEVAGLMTSGAVFVYCAYLLYSALGRVPAGACMRSAVGDKWVQVSVAACVSVGCKTAGSPAAWSCWDMGDLGALCGASTRVCTTARTLLLPVASIPSQRLPPSTRVIPPPNPQIVGFFLAIGAVCYSTMSLGTSSIFTNGSITPGADATETLPGDGGGGSGPLPYRPDAFHLIFALASMYMAMLFTNWQVSSNTTKFELGTGWTSTWITMGSKWFCELLYLWTVVAPAVLRDRDFT